MIFPTKRAGYAPHLQKSPLIDYLHRGYLILHVYTDEDKPEMTMPKQIDVKVTNPQNKHGQGKTRKFPIGSDEYCFTSRSRIIRQ